jgi:DNA-binding transcriptional regulator LsrR (DeoR family)
MGRPRRIIPERYAFRLCEKFFTEKREGRRIGATSLARWLQSKGISCSREQVYDLLNEGIDRGYLKLCAPPEISLSRQMARVFGFREEQMEVLNVIGPTIEERLGQAAAERVLERIREIGATGKSIHIGFGAGMTTCLVAAALAKLLRFEPDLPQITIHALSSGFSVVRPQTAPMAYFAFFNGLNPPVNFVGLFAPAVVNFHEYESIIELPGVKESFEWRAKIDIVVTSLAKKEDNDGQLNRFMRLAPQWGVGALEEACWVGDIQWRPYSDSGPVNIDTAIRAVTLYEIPDLLEFAGTPGKSVIVVCGRCNVCHDDKARALLPLLREPSLRVLNHLVTDRTTAQRVLTLASEIPVPAKGRE